MSFLFQQRKHWKHLLVSSESFKSLVYNRDTGNHNAMKDCYWSIDVKKTCLNFKKKFKKQKCHTGNKSMLGFLERWIDNIQNRLSKVNNKLKRKKSVSG